MIKSEEELKLKELENELFDEEIIRWELEDRLNYRKGYEPNKRNSI